MSVSLVWRDESAKFSTALWLAGVFPSLSARVFVLKESEREKEILSWVEHMFYISGSTSTYKDRCL